jgi:hypothetical protein
MNIVRYLPCLAHAETIVACEFTFMTALEQLTPPSPSGCKIIGATSTFGRIYTSAYVSSPGFKFGEKQKQPDTGVRLLTSKFPVFEVGDLGNLGQLQMDARLWLRDIPEVSQSS